MAAGFPAPIVAAIPSDGIIAANTPAFISQSYFWVPTDLEQGTLHSWNVAFQREMFWGLTGEVAYVGNRSNDILYRFNINAGMTPGLDRDGQPLYTLYGKTAEVRNLAWKGKSRYNGLQMKVDRKFRGGWLVTNSYTYGKGRDYSNENDWPSAPRPTPSAAGDSSTTTARTTTSIHVRVGAALVQGRPAASRSGCWATGR